MLLMPARREQKFHDGFLSIHEEPKVFSGHALWKSARTMGIDLADLHTMAQGAGDGTPFLVIQAISKKSS